MVRQPRHNQTNSMPHNPLLKLEQSPLEQQQELSLRRWLAQPEFLLLERIIKTRATALMLNGSANKMTLAATQVGNAHADVDFDKANRLMECIKTIRAIADEPDAYQVGTIQFL